MLMVVLKYFLLTLNFVMIVMLINFPGMPACWYYLSCCTIFGVFSSKIKI